MVAGPTPLTRRSPSSDRKGPRESRLATIRLASAGPTLGKVSMASGDAVSRSIGPASWGAGAFPFLRPLPTLLDPVTMVSAEGP
jgi:hypothetical protein